MKSLFESLKGFFKYDHNAIIKRFASEELDYVNKEIGELLTRRSRLESMLFGN